MHGDSIIVDLGLAIVAATGLAYAARFLGQPILLAYIAAGLLIGPPGLGLVHNERTIAELAELGLAFLMFIVGLEIDLKKLVSSGRTGVLVGVLQVVSCSLLAAGAMWLLGYRGLPLLYLGVASAFSSTMIVVKLLADESELDTVDGRITLGILLVQDVLAIVVLALQPNLQEPSFGPIGTSLLSGLGLVAVALATARFVLPPLFRWAAKSPEIVLISAISWCLFIGYLAILANFSIAMGALIAGVTLSALPYTLDVVAKISALRDFFVTLFFVALGMQLELGTPAVLASAAVLSAAVIVSRFLTVGPLLVALGYGPRVGILSSLALAQTGEFALVIVTVGLALGQIDRDVASVIALALVVTATLSTYMMTARHRLAQRWVSALQWLGLQVDAGPEAATDSLPAAPEIVLLGFHRVASSLLHRLQYEMVGRHRFVVVDFSPEVFRHLREVAVPVVYGDISHLDTLAHAGVASARVVISTVSDDFLRGTDNATLLRQVRRLNANARVILAAETLARARALYEAGADYVILPRDETAKAYEVALQALEEGRLDDLRSQAMQELADREEVMT